MTYRDYCCRDKDDMRWHKSWPLLLFVLERQAGVSVPLYMEQYANYLRNYKTFESFARQ